MEVYGLKISFHTHLSSMNLQLLKRQPLGVALQRGGSQHQAARSHGQGGAAEPAGKGRALALRLQREGANRRRGEQDPLLWLAQPPDQQGCYFLPPN